LLALLGGATVVVVSRLRVNMVYQERPNEKKLAKNYKKFANVQNK